MLFQELTIAHAFFREDKWLVRELGHIYAFLPAQRIAGGSDKMRGYLFFGGDPVILVVDVLIQRIDQICLVLVQNCLLYTSRCV